MAKWTVNGNEWNVVDVGQGPAILFVHGFPLDHSMWRSQWEELTNRYRCVVPDLSGFGQSESSESILTMPGLADDLACLLDLLSLPKVVFCGLSMGGYVGWEMWHRHGDRLRAMVMCDTRAVADSPEVARGREMMAQSVVAEGSESVAISMVPKLLSPDPFCGRKDLITRLTNMISATDPSIIASAQLGMSRRRDFSGSLSELHLPALFVCGSDDMISTVEEMKGMASEVPNARFVEIESAGHLPPLENPIAFNRALEQWLTELPESD